MMQMVFAAIMVMQRMLGHLEQAKPPPSKAMNCTAPPGICRYWVPSVSKPNEPTMMEVNWIESAVVNFLARYENIRL